MAESQRAPDAEDEEAWRTLLDRATPPSRQRRARERFTETFKASVRGLPKQIQRTVIIGGVAFVIGWIGNVWLLAFEYDGFRSPPGSPATGEGSRVVGSLFWMLLSAAVVATVSYRMKVGGPRFRSDIQAFPGRLKELLTSHRSTAAIHLLWGIAGALILILFTGTSLVFLTGLTLVAGLATFARPFIVGLIGFLWRSVAGRVAPGRKRPPAPGAMALAGTGGLLAAVVAGAIPDDSGRVLLALLAGGAAFALSRKNDAPRSAVAGLLFALACAGFVAAASPAAADDGGAIECPDSWPDDCPGVDRVFEESLTGALAALIGALIGDSVGRSGREDDDDDDPLIGMCQLDDDLEDDEYYVIEWEWVEGAGSMATGSRSRAEYEKEQAEAELSSYEKAMAKKREIEALEKKVQALDDDLAALEKRVNDTLSAKPWSELTGTERASMKRQLISTLKAQGQPNEEVQRVVGLLESDGGMSTGDFMAYLLGDVILRTPGETWDMGGKAIDAISREVKGLPSVLSNLGAAYAEDVASGAQATRLASPFTGAYEYYKGKTVAQVRADFASMGQSISDSSAQSFMNTIEMVHKAQVSGDVEGISKPLAQALGAIVSEEVLTLGLAKGMKLTKAGMNLLQDQLKLQRMLPDVPAGAGTALRAADDVPPPTIDNWVKAPKGTPIDTPEKLADFGALPKEVEALQKVSDSEGVIIEMRPGGRERAHHLANGNVGQKGQYNHNNTVKAADLDLGVGFRPDDVGLAGGLTPRMYDQLSDPGHFASLSPSAQARAKERMAEYIDRQHEVAKLAEGKMERVPDPNAPKGRSTVTQRRVRDDYGVDRDPTSGDPNDPSTWRADTGDWDIGDIRLPDRAFFHDEFGNPLTDHALLRADQAKYNQVVRRLFAEVGEGSIRHPGGYWKPKIKLVKNKKTGKLEQNCADVKTNRRINEKNYEGNPNAEANLQVTPGGSSPTASYRSTPKPRYDQALPGE